MKFSSRTPMRFAGGRETLLAIGAQVLACAVGVLWGFAVVRRYPLGWLWFLGRCDRLQPGLAALLCLLGESIHSLAKSRPENAKIYMCFLCVCLLITNGFIIVVDPFSQYIGDGPSVGDIALLLPSLLAIGPLARARAWAGVVGAMIFLATGLAMIVVNGSNWKGVGSGFLSLGLAT